MPQLIDDKNLGPSQNMEKSMEKRRRDFARLIEEHQTTLLRSARRLCSGGEDQAQDLVQDALIRGYRAYLAGRFEEGTNARAWLLRILTNLYFTEYQRHKRWDAGVDLDTLTGEGDTGPDALRAKETDRPEDVLLANSLDEPLELALKKLPDDLQTCVILVDIEELSYDEAATIMEVPVGTIRSRLFRARQKLHALLYSYGENLGLNSA